MALNIMNKTEQAHKHTAQVNYSIVNTVKKLASKMKTCRNPKSQTPAPKNMIVHTNQFPKPLCYWRLAFFETLISEKARECPK